MKLKCICISYLLDNIDSYYRILDIIHGLFKPVSKRFKDRMNFNLNDYLMALEQNFKKTTCVHDRIASACWSMSKILIGIVKRR